MLAATGDAAEALASGLHAAMFGLIQQWVRSNGAFDLVERWMVVVSRLVP
jgi:hypothetical protein